MSTNARLTSPFRYPGSKQALAEYFKTFLEANGINSPHLFEVFAGGASLSLSLLADRAVSEVTLVEKDPLVYAFWKCVKDAPSDLCERVWTIEPTLQVWQRFLPYRDAKDVRAYPLLDLAAAGLFFNRVNYSGILGAKPIGGMSQKSDYKIDCRWNAQRTVNQICDIAKYADKIHVALEDAVDYMKRNVTRISALRKKKAAIVYVDPPYYVQGKKLYRYFFTERQHERLAQFLNGSNLPWLTSYDNHPRILELFEGCKIVPFYLKYTVRRARNADELLITDLQHLPQPVAQKPVGALPVAQAI